LRQRQSSCRFFMAIVRIYMNIYVGNLDYHISEDDLKSAFEAFGTVESARIISDRDSGRSKGFGFIEMPDRSEALAAIDGMNGKELGGRKIVVNESKPREQGGGGGGGDRRRQGGGGGGGGFRGGRGGSSGGGNRGGGRRF
jgi:RNA recognition motif-containing protein